MAEYLRTVRLPSKGLLYEDPIYRGDIVLDMMGFAEEKLVFGSTSDTVLYKVLKQVVKTEGFDPYILNPNDFLYLLMQERIHSYGPTYLLNAPCPKCGVVSDVKVNLEELPVAELPDDFKQPFDTVLPISGDTVSLRLITSKDMDKINADAKFQKEKLKKNPNEAIYVGNLVKSVVAINGETKSDGDIRAYFEGLKGRDFAKIANALKKYTFGYSDMVDIECPACHSLISVPLTMTSEFFRPSDDE